MRKHLFNQYLGIFLMLFLSLGMFCGCQKDKLAEPTPTSYVKPEMYAIRHTGTPRVGEILFFQIGRNPGTAS